MSVDAEQTKGIPIEELAFARDVPEGTQELLRMGWVLRADREWDDEQLVTILSYFYRDTNLRVVTEERGLKDPSSARYRLLSCLERAKEVIEETRGSLPENLRIELKRPRTREARAKLSQMRMGNRLPETARNKRSESMIARWNTEGHRERAERGIVRSWRERGLDWELSDRSWIADFWNVVKQMGRDKIGEIGYIRPGDLEILERKFERGDAVTISSSLSIRLNRAALRLGI